MGKHSPNLTNEILQLDDTNVGSNGISLSQFLRLSTNERNSDVMLRLVRGHIACKAASDTTLGQVRFVIMTSNDKGDNPIFADRDLEGQNIWEQACTYTRNDARGIDSVAFHHFQQNLAIKIPQDKNVFYAIINEDAVTAVIGFAIRLFWSLI